MLRSLTPSALPTLGLGGGGGGLPPLGSRQLPLPPLGATGGLGSGAGMRPSLSPLMR